MSVIKEISAPAVDYLTEREGGMRLDVHDDGFGYPTVGVGHLVLDRDNLEIGDEITPAQGRAFLQDDLYEAREAVMRYVKVDLAQHEFDALVIFAFNIGVGAFRKSSLVRRLNAGEDRKSVAKFEMPRWNKVRGKYVRGLKNRRVDTAQMFTDADYTVDWSGLEGQDNG